MGWTQFNSNNLLSKKEIGYYLDNCSTPAYRMIYKQYLTSYFNPALIYIHQDKNITQFKAVHNNTATYFSDISP